MEELTCICFGSGHQKKQMLGSKLSSWLILSGRNGQINCSLLASKYPYRYVGGVPRPSLNCARHGQRDSKNTINTQQQRQVHALERGCTPTVGKTYVLCLWVLGQYSECSLQNKYSYSSPRSLVFNVHVCSIAFFNKERRSYDFCNF